MDELAAGFVHLLVSWCRSCQSVYPLICVCLNEFDLKVPVVLQGSILSCPAALWETLRYWNGELGLMHTRMFIKNMVLPPQIPQT